MKTNLIKISTAVLLLLSFCAAEAIVPAGTRPTPACGWHRLRFNNKTTCLNSCRNKKSPEFDKRLKKYCTPGTWQASAAMERLGDEPAVNVAARVEASSSDPCNRYCADTDSAAL